MHVGGVVLQSKMPWSQAFAGVHAAPPTHPASADTTASPPVSETIPVSAAPVSSEPVVPSGGGALASRPESVPPVVASGPPPVVPEASSSDAPSGLAFALASSSGLGTSLDPRICAHPQSESASAIATNRGDKDITQNRPPRDTPAPPMPTLGEIVKPVACGVAGSFFPVKKSATPPATSTPPAMNAAVETVESVESVE